ncbi:MAG: IS66 family transposase [candidate division NC10 bacterium]
MNAKLEIVDIPRDRIEAALAAARPALAEGDFGVLERVAGAYLTLVEVLARKDLSLRRLRRMLFGAATEKTATVLGSATEGRGGEPSQGAAPPGGSDPPKDGAGRQARGHGRNGEEDFPGASRRRIQHEKLRSGDGCPGCSKGKVYPQADRPGILVRVIGQPPLTATVYELEKLRCNTCGEIFEAEPPPGVGTEKYDASAASMIGLLKYGGGVPFYRLGKVQTGLGIPLPASTQWEIVRDAAAHLEPVHEELIRQAAQGKVLYNDDTGMRILERMGKRRERARCAQAESGEPEVAETKAGRTGIFTTGIVSEVRDRRIALFFTGGRHAGENLARVLAERAEGRRPPIQMCDALSRNVPGDFETILANCVTHGRRNFVDVVESFPRECEYVLRQLGEVYKNDAVAREREMTDVERLRYHQERSGPVMEDLQAWMEAQLVEKKVEPNSGLGEAIRYFLKRWDELTLFLRKAGAPLDNSVCERALKKAVLHRKNALFYKTDKGAHVGDVFMTLIHTCELNGVNPFDYLTEIQRHAEEARAEPGKWLPWNYRRARPRSPPD